MKLVASGLTGTIGVHLNEYNIHPLNERLDSLSKNVNLEKDDIYFHLGGIIGPGKVKENLKLSTEVNVESVKSLAAFSRERGIRKFVYISSAHVYKKNSSNIKEDDEIEPLNVYAEQKLAAEEILKEAFHESPSQLTILRVFSILDWDTKDFTLGGAVRRLNEDSSFTLGNGDDVRDFLTPKQAAYVIHKIGTTEHAEQTINVCTGFGQKISDAARVLLASIGDTSSFTRIEKGISDTPRIVGDSTVLESIIKQSLKWEYAQ